MTTKWPEITSGVLIALLSGLSVSAFNLHTDVQLLKEQTRAMQESAKERKETTKNISEMMVHLDKTLAVQSQVVDALRDAVNRLEKTNPYPWKEEKK